MELASSYRHAALILGLLSLCVVPTASLLFGVRLFGRRWSDLARDKEAYSFHLRTGVDSLAHDFRAIIQSLRTDLRLMRRVPPMGADPETIGRLSRTVGQFELATENIDSSLLGRIRCNTSPTKVQLFVPFIVRHAVDYHNSLHASAGASITYRCRSEDGACFVLAHLAQINRLLGNLINNALEGCGDRQQPTVIVNVSRTNSTVVIQVSDNGAGIRARRHPEPVRTLVYDKGRESGSRPHKLSSDRRGPRGKHQV